MKTIVIASQNPVKLQAVQDGFHRMFPEEEFQLSPVNVSSGVSDQPSSDEETLRGALQRTQAAEQLIPTADYWVGVEGGVDECPLTNSMPDLFAFAWIVIRSKTTTGMGRTGAFRLPPEVTRLIREGYELGNADDIVFGRVNSKQENGAVGLLTDNLIDRKQLYEQAVILALIPIKNQNLY
jgi:inosine/xanthosine triphosphatase